MGVRLGVVAASFLACSVPPIDATEFGCERHRDCPDPLVCLSGRCAEAPRCGDAVQNQGEVCDDGGRSEGCLDCQPAPGWICQGEPGQTSRCRQGRFGSITGGAFHVCALDQGAVHCWGLDAPDALEPVHGLRAGGPRTCAIRDADDSVVCFGTETPTVPPDLGEVVEVDPGTEHVCVRRTGGSVRCFGNVNGGSSPVPPRLLAAQVAAAHYHTCVLTSLGVPRCWGDPEKAAAPEGPFERLAEGNFHTCGIRPGGSLACWGRDTAETRRLQHPLGDGFTDVACGHYHCCGLVNQDAVCWGKPPDDHGQAVGRPGPFRQLTAGENYTCGLTVDDHVECWGQIEE